MENSYDHLLTEVDSLLQKAATLTDPAARDLLSSTVRVLMELHGEALAKIVEKCGPAVLEKFAVDDAVSGLLLLYGLHPHDLAMRVNAALESIRPSLKSHDGFVELIDLSADGAVRLKFACRGCGSTKATLQREIESAIDLKAPDVTSIAIESASDTSNGFVPIEMLSKKIRHGQDAHDTVGGKAPVALPLA